MITTTSGEDKNLIFAFAQSQGKRDNQQDAFGSADNECFLVADGIGGAPHGEIASNMAIERGLFAYSVLSKKRFYWEAKEHLLLKLSRAVSRGLFLQTKKYSGFGTTLVALCFGSTRWFVGNVGDSRAYLLRDGKLTQLTTDHQDQHGYLTRWIPMEKFTKMNITSGDIESGDVFLLTTDGLLLGIGEKEIQKKLAEIENTSESVKTTAEQLIKQSLERDSRDNITVCVVKKLPSADLDIQPVTVGVEER